jgi:hypothetical protein
MSALASKAGSCGTGIVSDQIVLFWVPRRYTLNRCQIFRRVKCLSACVSTKWSFLRRLHSTASVDYAARAFGSRITVRSNPCACVELAAPLTMLKSVSPLALTKAAKALGFRRTSRAPNYSEAGEQCESWRLLDLSRRARSRARAR